MARPKTTKPPEDMTATANAEVIAADAAPANQDRQRLAEIEANYGDGQPFNLDVSVNRVRSHLGNACESMIAAGKELIRIKEHLPYGEFIEALEHRIGVNPNTARRLMQAAYRFTQIPASDRSTWIDLIRSRSKFITLLTESTEEELKEFEKGGTVVGRTLDEYARMTVAELRAAMRDARADLAARDQVLAHKERKINEYETEIAKRLKWSPDQRTADLLGKLRIEMDAAVVAINIGMRAALLRIGEFEAAPDHLRLACSQSLAAVVRAAMELRADFALDCDIESEILPEWMQDGPWQAPKGEGKSEH